MKNFITSLLMLSGTFSFAGIVVKDIDDVTVNAMTPLDFDFNDDGTVEFTFMETNGIIGSSFDGEDVNFYTFGTGTTGGWDIMKPLMEGTAIGPGGTFGAWVDAYINPSWANAQQMFPEGDSYIGTKFKLANVMHYGWILVNLNQGAVTVKSYAYNTAENAAIDAGDTVLGTESFDRYFMLFYPNPSVDIITFTHDVSAVLATDLTGKTTIIALQGNSADISGLATGVYVLSITDTFGKKTGMNFIKK